MKKTLKKMVKVHNQMTTLNEKEENKGDATHHAKGVVVMTNQIVKSNYR